MHLSKPQLRKQLSFVGVLNTSLTNLCGVSLGASAKSLCAGVKIVCKCMSNLWSSGFNGLPIVGASFRHFMSEYTLQPSLDTSALRLAAFGNDDDDVPEVVVVVVGKLCYNTTVLGAPLPSGGGVCPDAARGALAMGFAGGHVLSRVCFVLGKAKLKRLCGFSGVIFFVFVRTSTTTTRSIFSPRSAATALQIKFAGKRSTANSRSEKTRLAKLWTRLVSLRHRAAFVCFSTQSRTQDASARDSSGSGLGRH